MRGPPASVALAGDGDEEKAIAQQYLALLGAIKGVLVNPKVVRVGAKKVAV